MRKRNRSKGDSDGWGIIIIEIIGVILESLITII